MKTIYGTQNDDYILGSSIGETILDSSGNDFVQAGKGDDIIVNNGLGFDKLFGQAGDDHFFFYDVLQSGFRSVTANGGSGDDIFGLYAFKPQSFDNHEFILNGGDGFDTLELASGTPNFDVDFHKNKVILSSEDFDTRIVLKNIEAIDFL